MPYVIGGVVLLLVLLLVWINISFARRQDESPRKTTRRDKNSNITDNSSLGNGSFSAIESHKEAPQEARTSDTQTVDVEANNDEGHRNDEHRSTGDGTGIHRRGGRHARGRDGKVAESNDQHLAGAANATDVADAAYAGDADTGDGANATEKSPEAGEDTGRGTLAHAGADVETGVGVGKDQGRVEGQSERESESKREELKAEGGAPSDHQSSQAVEVLEEEQYHSTSVVFNRPPYYINVLRVPEFGNDDWRQSFDFLTKNESVLGWIAFDGDLVGASDRRYDDDFLEALRQHRNSTQKLQRHVGLSQVLETSISGEEGKVWFLTVVDDAWFALFVDRSVNSTELTQKLLEAQGSTTAD